MTEGFAVDAIRVRAHLHNDPAVAVCVARSLLRGELRRPEPIVATVVQGHLALDWIGATLTAIALLSEKMVSLMRSANVSGWETYPVDVRSKVGKSISGYHGLVVHGTSGPKQDRLVVEESKIGASGKPYTTRTGFYIDPATWDGNDLFSPFGTTAIFATERVRDLLVAAQVSNIEFVDPASVDVFP